MLIDKQQEPNHNFLGLLSLETIFWHKSFFRSNFVTYFLSLISIQKTIKYKRYHDLIKNVLSFIEFRTNCMAERQYQQLFYTFCDSDSNQGQILIYENNYQYLYHTIFTIAAVRNNLYIRPFSRITSSNISRALCQPGTYIITQPHFYTSGKKIQHLWIAYYCPNTYF